MSVRSASRLASALVASMTLSACWLFPFPVGIGPSLQLVVENTTDADWVLHVGGGAFPPLSYAIPAGETGQVELVGGAPSFVTLLDLECEEIDSIAWDGSSTAVRIEAPGALEPLDELEPVEDNRFAEYDDCGYAKSLESGEPLPGASGSIVVMGGNPGTWRVNVATAEITPLVENDSPAHYEHAASPDGSQVAFTRFEDGSALSSVVVMAADGTNERVLAEEASTPIWSPDGTRIAYMDLDPFAGTSALSAIDLVSGEVVELADDVVTARWAPDGTRLALIAGDYMSPSFDPTAPDATELRVVNGDGTDLRNLAPAAPYAPAPAWSPDGAFIAFSALLGPVDDIPITVPAGIQVYDLDRGSLRTVAEIEGANLGEPAWSPDGSEIAFSITRNGLMGSSGSIGIMPARGGGGTEEIGALNNASYWTPVWSPDGKWIAATRIMGFESTGGLVALSVDSGDEVVLATGVSFNGHVWLK